MELLNFLLIVGLFLYIRHVSKRIDGIQPGQPAGALQQRVPPAGASAPAPFSTPVSAVAVPPPAGPPPAPPEPFDSAKFVSLLPKIGMAALVIGLGFFLKYAIDQGWVSINLRLFIGGAIGTLLLILFYLWREKYQKYALALAGGGLAIWYLTVFAAVELYNILSTDGGFAVLIIITLTGLLLAYKTGSKALAAICWGGAYLVPVILSVGANNYALLLAYLTFVSIALLISVFYNQARYLFVLALCGTAFNLFNASLSVHHSHEYYLHTLLFLLVHLFLYTILLAFAIRREDPSTQHANQREYSLMFSIMYLFLAVPLATIAYNEFRDLASVIMCAVGVWTFLVYSFIDRLEFSNVNYILSGIGAAVLSLAIFWHFGTSSQVVMLYVLGLLGLTVGRIQQRAELRVWGLATAMAGIIATLAVAYPYGNTTLLFTEKFGLEMLGLAALAIAYHIFSRQNLSSFEANIHNAIEYIIAVLLWLFVSWDLVNHFSAYGQQNQRNLSLSLWWILYAVILLAASAIDTLKPLRKLGLLLFGLVILKVFLYDLQNLETVYRIISFISLGLILLIVSFIYQKNKEKIKHYLES